MNNPDERALFAVIDTLPPATFVNRGDRNYYTFDLPDGRIVGVCEAAKGRRARWITHVNSPPPGTP